MSEQKIKFLKSISAGAIIAVIFIAAVTIAADLIPSLKDWLKATFSHHWVGKSILSLAIFLVSSFVLYFVPSKSTPTAENLNKLLSRLFWTSIFSSLAIFAFFIWEVFLK